MRANTSPGLVASPGAAPPAAEGAPAPEPARSVPAPVAASGRATAPKPAAEPTAAAAPEEAAPKPAAEPTATPASKPVTKPENAPLAPTTHAGPQVPEELSLSLADLRVPNVGASAATAATGTVPEELSLSLADLRVPQLGAPPTASATSGPVSEELSVSVADLRPIDVPKRVTSSRRHNTPATGSQVLDGAKDRAESLEGVAIGRYVLRHLIAQGGMASVYLAQLSGDEGFARWVAIKIIHPHLARDPRYVTMFLDEARIASRIGHPNVCAVLDYGSGPPPHLVMEHMHGEPLSSLGKAAAAHGGTVPVWLALRVVADAARGLHAAHELRGADGKPLEVVHRDVSMQNVFVLYDGLTKVLDFGVAKARNRMSATETGELKGKIAYMPPDVLSGATADRRTDVWGLGVVLWELLANRRLFRGPNEATTVHNVLHRKVPPLASLRGDVPPAIDAILQRALERDPTRRIQTAALLADQLETQLHLAGVPAGPAQIAAWMGEVLSERKTTRERVLGALAHGDEQPSDRDLAALHTDDLLEPSDAHEIALGLAPKRRRLWPFGILAAGILGAGVIGWLAASPGAEPSDPTHETVTAPGTDRVVGHDPSSIGTTPTTTGSEGVQPTIEGVTTQQATTEQATAEQATAEQATAEQATAEQATTEQATAEQATTAQATAAQATAAQATTAQATTAQATTEHRSTERPVSQAQPERDRTTGTLNLMAVPPADVMLGGRRLGRTPLVGVSLPAGRHQLTLRPVGGGPSHTTTVVIRPGGRTLESVRL